ncbi:RES domain-containing protein [Fodinicurvata halophila]
MPSTQSTSPGRGSRLYGGRWTPPGYPAIYTSEHPALAAWGKRGALRA